MNRESQVADELQTLRALCNEASPRETRQKLLQSLSLRSFLEPEHQVVFESIRALFPRGPISAAQLQIQLNNRGFPDTDVEKYFDGEPAADIARDAQKPTAP
jgi:hypothetical protein